MDLGKIIKFGSAMGAIQKVADEFSQIARMQEQLAEISRQAEEQRKILFRALEAPRINLPTLDDLSEGIKETFSALMQYGWYMNLGVFMTDIAKCKILLREEKIDQLDAHMADVIKHDLKHIKRKLLEAYPNREIPLKEAFHAHENELYSLSIPVFFAQADGICKELTTYLLFINENQQQDYAPKVKAWALQYARSDFDKAWCAGLLEKGAFQLHYTQPNKIAFTRHSVLHGEVTDYGTEINSLKAISLLFYISEAISQRTPITA